MIWWSWAAGLIVGLGLGLIVLVQSSLKHDREREQIHMEWSEKYNQQSERLYRVIAVGRDRVHELEVFARKVAKFYVRWAYDSATAPGPPNLGMSAGIAMAFHDHGLDEMLSKAVAERDHTINGPRFLGHEHDVDDENESVNFIRHAHEDGNVYHLHESESGLTFRSYRIWRTDDDAGSVGKDVVLPGVSRDQADHQG